MSSIATVVKQANMCFAAINNASQMFLNTSADTHNGLCILADHTDNRKSLVSEQPPTNYNNS